MILGADFRRLWGAYAVSELGTALGFGALPLIATLVLHAPVLQVSLLTALGGFAGAVLAVPLGPFIEFRPKRPVLVAADLAAGELLLIAFSGVFTPAFATWRLRGTDDGCLARVLAAWSISSRIAQPAGTAAAGLLAAAGVRPALAVVAAVVALSAALLPWRPPSPRGGRGRRGPERRPPALAPAPARTNGRRGSQPAGRKRRAAGRKQRAAGRPERQPAGRRG